MLGVIVITGAGSGLGFVTCQRLLSEGYHVIGMDVNCKGLEGEIQNASGHLDVVQVDVTDIESVEAAMESLGNLGVDAIDAVVHFAGVNLGGPMCEMQEAQFSLVFKVNVLGVWRMQKYLFRMLRNSRRYAGAGRTVIVSSEVGLYGASTAFSAPYASSKMALEGIAIGLRQEFSLLDPAMPVIVLNPGAHATPLLEETVFSNFQRPMELGSSWNAFLPRARDQASQYIARNTSSPTQVAAAVHDAITAKVPKDR
eukprot:gnl/MRDRNA2_/MRDRNA2_158571_c0_seq1.p1 gnl/MRDRNA2_/MRDRNA2_158571_c0~~gnl/MRDRNA2_/MRDRNA2_158571_c0_seq1.p1  ORF type:complete len:255 (+),score=46.29 gnl/MRDRNA2_/MRDRNA2_158571_c0_seq1:143-907(+)